MSALNERILPLEELDDFEIAEGDPDVRGWRVFASDGVRIGFVDGLLIDTEEMKVRYLDVELRGAAGPDADRHILLPIGCARLDAKDDHIRVDRFDSVTLLALPGYAREPLTHDYEADLMQRLRSGAPDAVRQGDAGPPYAGEHYDEERFYGSRRGEIDR